MNDFPSSYISTPYTALGIIGCVGKSLRMRANLMVATAQRSLEELDTRATRAPHDEAEVDSREKRAETRGALASSSHKRLFSGWARHKVERVRQQESVKRSQIARGRGSSRIRDRELPGELQPANARNL